MTKKDMRIIMGTHRPWYKTAIIWTCNLIRDSLILAALYALYAATYEIYATRADPMSFYEYNVYLGVRIAGVTGAVCVVAWSAKLYTWASK